MVTASRKARPNKANSLEAVPETLYIDDIFCRMKPIQTLGKIFGLNALNDQHQLSLVAMVYSAVFLSGLVYCFLFVGHNYRCEPRDCPFEAVKGAVNGVTLVALFLTIAKRIYQRKQTHQVFLKVVSIDERMSKLGILVAYPKISLIRASGVVWSIAAWIGCHCLLLALTKDKNYLLYAIKESVDTFVVLLVYIIARNFTTVMCCIEKHYDLLTKCVKGGIYCPNPNYKSLLKSGILNTFKEVCYLSDLAEEVHCREITLLFLPIFMNIIVGAYSEIVLFQTAFYQKDTFSLTGFIYNCFSPFVNLAMWCLVLVQIIRSCELCKNKARKMVKVRWIIEDSANEFNTALYTAAMGDQTKTLIGDEKLQLHIIMKKEVQFTACGFFPLDFTLIHSITAAATTYLIIFLQFDSPNEAN